MAFTLPALPYARDALAPHISEQTLNFHYGKHHQAYLDNLNKLVAGTLLARAQRNEDGGRRARKANRDRRHVHHTGRWRAR